MCLFGSGSLTLLPWITCILCCLRQAGPHAVTELRCAGAQVVAALITLQAAREGIYAAQVELASSRIGLQAAQLEYAASQIGVSRTCPPCNLILHSMGWR